MISYAGFWKRFGATLIDAILTGIVYALISPCFGSYKEVIANPSGYYLLICLAIDWLYFAILESSSMQATPGKAAFGIIVTDLDGERISFIRATGRYFSKYVSILIIFIGFLMAGFTKKKQALHDMMVGTLVINR